MSKLVKFVPIVVVLVLLAFNSLPAALADNPDDHNGNPARGTVFNSDNSDHKGNPQVCLSTHTSGSGKDQHHGHTSDPSSCATAPSQPSTIAVPPSAVTVVVPPSGVTNPVAQQQNAQPQQSGQIGLGAPIPNGQQQNGQPQQPLTTLAPMSSSCTADYMVQSGDQLGRISSQLLGSATLFPNIVTATNSAAASNNAYHQISNPNLLVAGWRLCIPAASQNGANSLGTQQQNGQNSVNNPSTQQNGQMQQNGQNGVNNPSAQPQQNGQMQQNGQLPQNGQNGVNNQAPSAQPQQNGQSQPSGQNGY